jgi:hypothetical protein
VGRRYAGILGLLAFSTSVLRAAIQGAGPDALLTATIQLFAFAAAGWIVGTIAEQTIEQSVRTRFEAELKAAEAGAKPGQTA